MPRSVHGPAARAAQSGHTSEGRTGRFLAPLVEGRLIKPTGGNHNFAELDDPRINALIDSAQAAAPQSRAERWTEVDRSVMEHAVMLPMVYDRTVHIRGRRVTNLYVHPAFGPYDIQAMG